MNAVKISDASFHVHFVRAIVIHGPKKTLKKMRIPLAQLSDIAGAAAAPGKSDSFFKYASLKRSRQVTRTSFLCRGRWKKQRRSSNL